MNEQPKDPEEIRQMLVELHDELERTKSLNPDQRSLLRHLMRDIQEMLGQDGAPGAQAYTPDENFLERMQRAIDLLEVSHPTLTSMIVKALDILNVAGI